MMQRMDTVFRFDAMSTYWFNAREIVQLLQIVFGAKVWSENQQHQHLLEDASSQALPQAC